MGTHTFERIDSIASKLAEKMDRTLQSAQEKKRAHLTAPRPNARQDAECLVDGNVWPRREKLSNLFGRMHAGFGTGERKRTSDDTRHY